MFQQPNTEDQVCEGSSSSNSTLTAGLLIHTVTTGNRRWRRLRYVVISFFISYHKKKTQCGGEALNYEPLPAAPPQPRPAAFSDDHVIEIPPPEEERFSDKVARIVREQDLTSLQTLGGVDRILPSLRSQDKDEAVDGGHQYSKFQFDEKGFLYFLLKACNRYTILFLLLSAGISFAIEFMKQGLKYGWHDGVAILLTLVLLVAFPSVRDYHNERGLKKHLLERSKLVVYAERSSGEPTPVTISEVVVGDIVHLKEGDCVPADGLFIDHDANLVLDDVLKHTIDREHYPFVLSGSKVINGRGRMIVTSVGANTAFAEVLSLATDHKLNEKTLSQALMDKPNAVMDYFALCGSILISLVVLIRQVFFRKHENYNDRPDLKGEVSMNLLMRIVQRIFLRPEGMVSILASALATVVIGIQHGMPSVITVALCKWHEKVVQNQADPQNLSACVTMGLITVICIETTGELTSHQGEVKEFWMGEKDLCIDNEVDSETDKVVLEALHQGISATPSPTNDLLISWLKTRWGTNMELLDQQFETIEQRQLSTNEKCLRILVTKIENGEQIMQLHCFGDASTILDRCSHYYDNRGEIHNIENQKRKFKQVAKNMKENGLGSIAYAYRTTQVQDDTEEGFVLLALVGHRRPYQEELRLAVEALRNTGVSIKLVSEDELSIVKARASELGISLDANDTEIIKGEVFRRLDSMERQDKLDMISVMASSLPKDKFLMVDRLKKKGHIVAFYGGLTISDTPTLKEADVGIADYIWSTETARENADLITRNVCLLNPILKSGACAYRNIQLFTQLQLTACISGLLIILIATILSGESPLTTVHLIWVNLIMCLLGGLMMVMELHVPEAERLITQRPSKRTESLITKVIWRKIAVQVSYQVSVLLIIHFMGNTALGMDDEDVRNTMIFNTFTLCQVLNLLSAMDLVKKEMLVVVLHSYWFLMALGAVFFIQVMIVEFGKGLATDVRLNAWQWSICFLLAALSWGSGWAIRLVSDRIGRTTLLSALIVFTCCGVLI